MKAGFLPIPNEGAGKFALLNLGSPVQFLANGMIGELFCSISKNSESTLSSY